MIYIGIETLIHPRILAVAKSVRRWVITNNNSTSNDMCFDAAYKLCFHFRKIKIHCKLHIGYFCLTTKFKIQNRGHCWVSFPKLRYQPILDVTADQFNKQILEYSQIFKEKPIKMRSIVFGTHSQLQHRFQL